MKPHIFIDMDGVLVDFVAGALAAHGMEPTEEILKSREMYQPMGITKQEFYEGIDRLGEWFWCSLQPTIWADDLMKAVKTANGRTGWSIATAPTRNSTSAKGKVLWMKEMFGVGFKNYLIGKNKHFLARPGHLLIDDSEEQVDRFREHGGQAILVPSPSNRMAGFDVMKQIEDSLHVWKAK